MTTRTQRWLTLPDAPPIPGLRVRPYVDAGDIPLLVELHRVVQRADGNTEVVTANELRLHFEHWTNFDPHEDDLLAFVDDQLVASSKMEWLDANDGRRLFYSVGHVHPEWRRRGIGSALMTRNERRLIEVAASQDDPRPRVLATNVEDSDIGAIVLAQARGYERVRIYHHLVRPDMDDIVVPPLPDGLGGPAHHERAAAAAVGCHDRGLSRPLRRRRHVARGLPPLVGGRRPRPVAPLRRLRG